MTGTGTLWNRVVGNELFAFTSVVAGPGAPTTWIAATKSLPLQPVAVNVPCAGAVKLNLKVKPAAGAVVVVVVPDGAVVVVGAGIVVADDATQAADAGFEVACEKRSPPPTRTSTITAARPLAVRSKKMPMTASTNPIPRTARRFDPVEARH